MQFYEGDTVTDNTKGKYLWVRDSNKKWQLNSGGHLVDRDIIEFLGTGALTWVKRAGKFKISDKAIIANTNGLDIYTRYRVDRWRQGQDSFGYLTDDQVSDFLKDGFVERVFSL